MPPDFPWGYWLAVGGGMTLVAWLVGAGQRFRLLSRYHRAAGWNRVANDALNLLEGPHTLVLTQFAVTALALESEQGRVPRGGAMMAGRLIAAGVILLAVPFLVRTIRLRLYLSLVLVVVGLAWRWPGTAAWIAAALLLLSVGYEVQARGLLNKARRRESEAELAVSIDDASAMMAGTLAIPAILAIAIHSLGPPLGPRIASAVTGGTVCAVLVLGRAGCLEVACGLEGAFGLGSFLIGLPFELLGRLPIWEPLLSRAFPEILGQRWSVPGKAEQSDAPVRN